VRCQIRLSSARCDKGHITAVTTICRQHLSTRRYPNEMFDSVLQPPSNMVTEVPLPASIRRRCHRDTLAASESNPCPACFPNGAAELLQSTFPSASRKVIMLNAPARGISSFVPPEWAVEVPGTVPHPPSAQKRILHRSKHFLYPSYGNPVEAIAPQGQCFVRVSR
jgi:hypothetical protein